MSLQTKKLTANGANGHHKFTLTVTENSTSPANNASSVAWSLALSPIVKNYDWTSNSGKVKYSIVFNGTTYSGVIKTYDGKSTVTIKTGTETVAHDADGTKTLSYSFSITDSTGWSFAPGNASAKGTMALTNIPRQATITAAPSFTDEQNPTIMYTNPAGSAVTSLELCISLDDSIKNALPYKEIADKTGTSFTYELSEEERTFLRNATPNSNTLDVCFCLRTVVPIGLTSAMYYSKVWKTLKIVNADPILDLSISETNKDIIALNGGAAFIRYYSDAEAISGAKALKGASIKSQSITCGGVTINSGAGTFSGVQNGVFVFTVTDSRGNTLRQPVSVQFVEYVKLSCNIGNGKPDTDGNLLFTVSGMCYNGDIPGCGANVLSVLYRYRASGETYRDEWKEMSVTLEGNAYTATANVADLDYRTTYHFQCKVSDLIDEIQPDEVAIKATPVFDWSENDFNFNVPVSMPELRVDGQRIADFVVDSGTKDIWQYRKWASGNVECWGRADITIPTDLTQAGSIYYSAPITVPYPFAINVAYRYTTTANSGVLSASISGGSSDEMSFRLHCARPEMAGQTAVVFLYVKGLWK